MKKFIVGQTERVMSIAIKETLPENVLPPGSKKYKRNPLSSAKLVER